MKSPNTMSIDEFVSLGLLQEVNRQLLHPMGVALSVILEDDGSMRWGEIVDYRTDPEGMAFADLLATPEAEDKFISVARMFEAKRAVRQATLGFHVQPIGSVCK